MFYSKSQSSCHLWVQSSNSPLRTRSNLHSTRNPLHKRSNSTASPNTLSNNHDLSFASVGEPAGTASAGLVEGSTPAGAVGTASVGAGRSLGVGIGLGACSYHREVSMLHKYVGGIDNIRLLWWRIAVELLRRHFC
jgi:hypothetical protein